MSRAALDLHSGSLPVVPGQAYPPAGRRTLWLHMVNRCPFCGYAHAHRGGAQGGVRAAGCRRGLYEVAPTSFAPGATDAA